jgi:hypothetical protein
VVFTARSFCIESLVKIIVRAQLALSVHLPSVPAVFSARVRALNQTIGSLSTSVFRLVCVERANRGCRTA